MNVILRVTGFGFLLLLVILVPIYKIFGLSNEFWIGLTVCVIFIGWAYAAYRKLYSVIICPECGFRIKYQQLRMVSTCPKCGKDLKDLADK